MLEWLPRETIVFDGARAMRDGIHDGFGNYLFGDFITTRDCNLFCTSFYPIIKFIKHKFKRLIHQLKNGSLKYFV